MSLKRPAGVILCVFLVAGVGCRKTNHVDKSAFQSAINSYYGAREQCVWASPVKLPAQADTSNEEQTKGFDALTDAGLMTRSSAEKKRFLIGSKQVSNYDLSDKGRTSWTADQSQPGYGNFCYGRRSVTSIDSYTPSNDDNASSYSVAYHDSVASVPDWAQSTEMKTAFPNLAADTSGQETATANLTKSTDGWQVGSVQPAGVLPQ
jgi:hypothetical protein